MNPVWRSVLAFVLVVTVLVANEQPVRAAEPIGANAGIAGLEFVDPDRLRVSANDAAAGDLTPWELVARLAPPGKDSFWSQVPPETVKKYS